jgi:serine/threonine protein kinase
MRPVANGTLKSFLERVSGSGVLNPQLSKAVQKWLGCLASALSYLLANDILHRRMKPSSIVIKDGKDFPTEFAVSNYFDETYVLVKEASGATASCDVYQAPEIEMQQQFGPKADIFSLGCVYVEMLTAAAGISLAKLKECFGEEPFSSYSRHLMRTMEWLAKVQGRLPLDFPKDFIDCCQSMLQHDPDARLSAFEVTKFIFKSNSKLLENSRTEMDCGCLLPWRSSEDGCKLLT